MSDETESTPTDAPSCASDHPHPSLDQARRNIRSFVDELGLASPGVHARDQAPGYHLEIGEFGFHLERGSRRVQVGMPGVPRPREGVDPWYFPRVSIDGSTYFWDVGIDAARRLLADPDRSDQERVEASRERCRAELRREPRCADCGAVRVAWQEPPVPGPEGPRPGEYRARCLCCDWVVEVRRDVPGGGAVYGGEDWRGREHDLVHQRRLPPEGLGLPCPGADCRRQRWHRGDCRPWWEVVSRARVPGAEPREAPASSLPHHDAATRLDQGARQGGDVHPDVWRQEGSHETHAARRRDLAAALGRGEGTDWVAMIGDVTRLAAERRMQAAESSRPASGRPDHSSPALDLEPDLEPGPGEGPGPRPAFLRRFQDVHGALHRRWTADVGRPGYDKSDWRALDNFLSELGREYATSIGIPRDHPLLLPISEAEAKPCAATSGAKYDSELTRPLTDAESVVWAVAFDRALASNVGASAAARAAYHEVVVLRTSCDHARLSAEARAMLQQVTGGRR